MERVPLLVVNHLLQHTLRSLCAGAEAAAAAAAAHAPEDDQHWVYSIFWRILPRNYPPPKWDNEAGPFDRNKGNKRNWILVWEDGFCDFAACSREALKESKEKSKAEEDGGQDEGPLQPELFFKMSHDVYNYGEGLMGKIAAEKSHKWIFRDPTEQEKVPFLSPWQASVDSYPRTWEAQFKAGIQTIAIIAVGEGLLQLGSTKKVQQNVDFVLMVQRKFNYLQSIPGVFAQTKIPRAIKSSNEAEVDKGTRPNGKMQQLSGLKRMAQPDNNEDDEACSSYPIMPLNLVGPPDSAYHSLQALLSKLPAVTPNVPMADATKLEVVMAANAGSLGVLGAPSRSMPSPKTSATDLLVGRLPMEVWPGSLLLCLPVPAPADPALPNLADEFETYHSLFGQLIS